MKKKSFKFADKEKKQDTTNLSNECKSYKIMVGNLKLIWRVKYGVSTTPTAETTVI